MLGIWEFLQSDFFGNSVSKNLNRVTKSQFGVALNFENLDFQLFPPGANLNHVEIQVSRHEVNASARVGKLGIYFNLLDSFRTKLTVKEFYMEDAVVVVESFTDEGKKRKQSGDTFDLNRAVIEAQEPLPFTVEKAFLRDVLVKYGSASQFINMASVSTTKRGLLTKGDLRQIDLSKYSKYQGRLDQVRFEANIHGEVVELKRLEISQGVNSAEASGRIVGYMKDPELNVKGSLLGEIRELHKYFDFDRIGKLRKGVAAGTFSFNGKVDRGLKRDSSAFQASAKMKVKNFDTDFIYGDILEAEASMDQNTIRVESALLKANDQTVVLEKPFDLYSFNENIFTRKPFSLLAQNLALGNALRYIDNTLSPLTGALSGKVDIALEDHGVRFFSDSSVDLKDVKVQTGSKPLLGAKTLTLVAPTFSIVNGAFFMDTAVKIKETSFKVVGGVSKGELDFSVREGRLSLEELGPLAGLDIKGRGTFDLGVKGRGRDVELKMKTELADFDFEGYRLQKVGGDIVFDFSESNIIISGLEGQEGKASLAGEAKINYRTLGLEAKGKLTSKRYRDVKKILTPLLGEVGAIPVDLYGNWNFDFNAEGKATLDDLVVNGTFSGKNNYLYNEGFEFFGFELLFAKRKLELGNILARKSSGIVRGEFSYNLPDGSMGYRFEANELPLSEIANYSKTPFAFDGVLSGKVLGEKRGEEQNALVDLKLTGTNLAGEDYPDSGLSVVMTNKELAYDMNLLGEEVSLGGRFMLQKSEEKSKIDLAVNSKDIRVPLGLLKFVDRNSLNMDGSIRLKAAATFEGLEYEKSDLTINLRELALSKDDLSLDYRNKNSSPQVLVKDGKIERWDLALKGQRVYLVSKGEGSLSGNYDIDSKFKIDAAVLEAFNTVVSQARGTVRAKARFYRNFFKEDYEAVLVGDSVSVSSDRLPSAVSDADFEVKYENKSVLIDKFSANLSSGEVNGKGRVVFSNIVPDIDFKLNFKEAGFPILKKSNLVVSGSTHLTGNKLPYSLTGEVKIQKLLLMNEIGDFKRGKQTVFTKEYDYLPERSSTIANNLVNMNVDIETVEPIMLNNSLADVGIVGNAQVIGGEEDFRVVGKFSLAPRNNKIFFKGNEYTLAKANIFFYQRNKVTNPELDIAAHSVINDHRVNIKVFGPVDDFKMELSSEPALTQEDVLSLIAFGYTEDLSANLSEQEKESMTRAGVGSIIFDSFKINETLKNEFGLKVNLGTEIQEENRGYLSRINSDSAVGRVNSATTIEVKKQLNEAVNLSVTSTVGGSIGQKQSMNLNYNINNQLSVEGVYETRTSAEGEETINDSSLGADVKIRWSFR